LADCCNVCQILRAAGGELVGDEIGGQDGACRKVAIDQDGYAVGINSSKVDAIDMLDYLEADGRDSKAANGLSVGKSAAVNVVSGAPNSARAL
jgi:uncharacterized protein with FMN-binding domain